jgi:predicted Zn finger-like uncharacterized protein
MSAVRLRRLQADYLKLKDYVSRHSRLELIQADGNPPERYQLQYQIRSLRQKEDRLVEVHRHLVEITLPLHYPRGPPLCRMLTPVFHPNIAPHAICIGDHWSAGEPLSAIVARIGELIAFQSYNTKSPLNGEAARWTTENLDRLPLDQVCMLLDEAPAGPAVDTLPTPPDAGRVATPPSRPNPGLAPAPLQPERETSIKLTCPECQASLKVAAELRGKRVRCPRCRGVVPVPETGGAT